MPTFDIVAAYKTVADVLGNERVNYAFIGALPVLAYGRVRATSDIDLVVTASKPEFDRLQAALAKSGFVVGRPIGPSEASDSLPDIAVFWFGAEPSVRLDLFIAKTDFERAVVAAPRTVEVLGKVVPLARPEASIIYKLIASRPKDLLDIESIFEARRAAGETLDWVFLQKWADEWQIVERLAPYRDRYGST